MTDKKLLICPNCARQNVRIRFKQKVWVCNLCGTTWPYTSGDSPVKSPKQTPQDHPAHPNKGS